VIRILTAALVIHAVSFVISAAQSARPAGDFDRYYEIGSTPGRPYVDYQVEHPIGTLLIFKSLARRRTDAPPSAWEWWHST